MVFLCMPKKRKPPENDVIEPLLKDTKKQQPKTQPADSEDEDDSSADKTSPTPWEYFPGDGGPV